MCQKGKLMQKSKLCDLRDEFDVRVNPIDQDYVIDLAMQYEDGVKLPPIKVTKDGIIVDGRHRFHAMMMAEFEDCAVQIISGSKSDLLLEAMCSNVGSKPMTSKDVQYVIGQLMDQGMKELQIINNLRDRCGYTSELTRRHMGAVRSNLRFRRLIDAAQLVLNKGFTIPQAAVKCEVSEAALRKHMGKKPTGALPQPLNALKRSDKAQRKKIWRIIVDALESYRDGDITETDMYEVVRSFHKIAESWEKMADDCQSRFDSARRGTRTEDVLLQQAAIA